MKKNIPTIVHTVSMGDVDDPDLYVAEPLYNWEKTEVGKWVMENSNPAPTWQRQTDHPHCFGWKYYIVGYFNEQDLTYYNLKFK